MASRRVSAALGALFAILSFLVTIGGAALCVWASFDVDPLDSGVLGLIQALPINYFVGIGMILVAFVFTLRRQKLNRPLLALQMLVLILALYGLTSLREDVARLPTGWVHAGFIQYIQENDMVLDNYDARFVWPGFFALGAMMNELAGLDTSNLFLAWAPLVSNLLYAVPVWLIIRAAGAPIRAAWLGTALFFLLNWVGQDYYSPQGLNMLFALCFFAVLMRVFFSQSKLVPTWIENIAHRVGNWALVAKTLSGANRRFPKTMAKLKVLEPGVPTRLAISGQQKAMLVGAMVILFAASVVSHQLTPFFLIIATFLLVLLDRLQIRVFPVLMFVGVLVWISYAAAPFWQGNLDQLFGDVGNVGSTLSQNVENRVTGDPDHLPVIWGRLALAASLWLLAAVGVVRRMRHGRLDVLCIVGFIAPFAILGGQAYGGEAVLRVYLYGLPFAAALAAMALAPALDGWNKKTTALVLVVLLGLTPTFFITRYGNEAFENFSAEEFELVEATYAMADDGSTLVSANSLLPWRGERIDRLRYLAIADSEIPDDVVTSIRETMLENADQESFFIASRAQDEYASISQGQIPRYTEEIAADLVASGDFKVAFRNSQGEVVVPVDQS